MTFPIDQLTSLPPTANASYRSQSDRNAREDENPRRADAPARDIEGGREVEPQTTAPDSDFSDFQRHLNDDAESRAAQRAETQDDSDAASQKAEDTHGETVSQVAITTQTPSQTPGKAEPSDATAPEQANKGIIVKTAAGNKPDTATDTQTNIKADTGDVTSLQANPDEPETATSPVSDDLSLVPGNPADNQPGVPGQSKTTITSAPVETAPAPSQSSPTKTMTDGVAQVEVRQDGPVDEDTGAGTPAPHYNESAHKVETSEHPGWGAEHAPRSDRGTQARELKSQNSDKASLTEANTEARTAAGSTPAATPADETVVTETIAPEQVFDASETIPTLTDPAILTAAVAVSGENAPGKSKASKVIPDINGISPASDKSAAGSNVPGSADKSSGKTAASQPTETRGANPAAPVDQQSGTTASASAIPNASPTGVAKALASGQGNMPMTGIQEVGQALASTDKRGTRNGARTPESIAEAAAGTKTGKAKAEGNAQSTFDATQNKSNAGSTSQAAHSQASATAINNQATPQPAQGAVVPTPIMPDPAALMGNANMNLPHGNATMEIDPATGALHLSGTGSARMSAPNLSEVTMQFSRARMVQTPAKDIAVQIAKHLSGGVNRFDIRITPPELGRIEVKLEIAESGKISAHLVADKSETLDLLQKDRATLEKALAEAGLNADEASLKFSMRDGKGDNNPNFKDLEIDAASNASDGPGTIHIENLAELEVSAYGFDIVRMKRLDISI